MFETEMYDYGRIRALMELIESGWWENIWVSIFNEDPVVDDGHHRLVAKHLLQHKHVTVNFDGTDTWIPYLTGKTPHLPKRRQP